MMINTALNEPVDSRLICNYFTSLVDSFFKILPMRESQEKSLVVYIKSLQRELFGCGNFIITLNDNPQFLRLLSILQFFINNPDEEVSVVKSEVFKAINICNKLKKVYYEED